MTSETYPHSLLSRLCKEKYQSKWAVFECVINSLQVYYKKIPKNSVKICVDVPELRTR